MEVKLPSTHVTLICGGTAPIGSSIALQLARAGAGSVIITGRDGSRGAAALAALRRDAPTTSFNFVRADLREETDAASMFEFVDKHCGGLDAYVHCIPPGAAGGSLAGAAAISSSFPLMRAGLRRQGIRSWQPFRAASWR